ncbi:MAG: cytochrome C [Phycisphaerae bacterium]
MEHTKHIIRAVLLLAVIAVAFVFVRHFAIPESFGEYGHYRYRSVDEHRSKPPVHGAPEACLECHDEEGEIWSEGKHGSVACEVCHAPLGSHVEANERVAPMLVQRTYDLCAWCHRRLVARPKDFPQVVIPGHGTEKGAEMSEDMCLECHDAHNPSE